MRYDVLEKELVDVIKTSVVDATGQPYFELVEQYGGQFESPYRNPEDFDPNRSPYCYIDIKDETQNAGGRSSLRDIQSQGRVALYVGSKESGVLAAKLTVFQGLDLIRKVLHGTTLANSNDANDLVNLFWQESTQEFGLPDHVCWTLTLKVLTNIRL
jgi:hypothetical protein